MQLVGKFVVNSMEVPVINGLFRRMLHPFYALLCLAKIGSSAAVVLPGSSPRSALPEAYWKETKPNFKRPDFRRLPNDTWDGHMHIIDPNRYPLAADAAYTPGVHSTWDAVTFENSVDMKNIIIVQPSIYGNDNGALLDALKALGAERSRAVVVFDNTAIDNSTLHEWHTLGVRGVRLNLASVDANPDIEAFKKTVSTYAALVKPLGWMVQIYMSMDMLPGLESTIREMKDVKFCFDHFAQPSQPKSNSTAPFDPYSITGFSSLISLLRNGNTWVKFSAPYRVDLDADQLAVFAKEVLRVRDDRVVFATDWPHTRFEGLDIRPFEERVLDWAREGKCVDKVFSANARELWGVER